MFQVKLLLGYQPNLVLQNSKRHTPIHLAARNGHKTMVALLLKHGMDVNVKVIQVFGCHSVITNLG